MTVVSKGAHHTFVVSLKDGQPVMTIVIRCEPGKYLVQVELQNQLNLHERGKAGRAMSGILQRRLDPFASLQLSSKTGTSSLVCPWCTTIFVCVFISCFLLCVAGIRNVMEVRRLNEHAMSQRDDLYEASSHTGSALGYNSRLDLTCVSRRPSGFSKSQVSSQHDKGNINAKLRPKQGPGSKFQLVFDYPLTAFLGFAIAVASLEASK